MLSNDESIILPVMIVRNVVPPPPHSGQRMSAVSVFQAVCLHKLLAPTDIRLVVNNQSICTSLSTNINLSVSRYVLNQSICAS